MNKGKLSFIGFIVMLLATIVNTLIYFDIIPFFIWILANLIAIVLLITISIKRKHIKEKDILMTFLEFIFALIFIIADTLVFIKFI